MFKQEKGMIMRERGIDGESARERERERERERGIELRRGTAGDRTK